MRPEEARRALWEDPAEWRAPWRTQASAFRDLVAAVAEGRPLGGGEQPFLEAATDWLRAGAEEDPGWNGPFGYGWVKEARRRLASRDGSAGREALARHLDRFHAFPLARAFQSGRDHLLPGPIRVDSPFALPGTRCSLDGAGAGLEIHGLRRGALVAGLPGAPPAVFPLGGDGPEADRPRGAILALHHAPAACHGGFELPLVPHAFAHLGVPQAEPALRAGLDYQRVHVEGLARTLAFVARFAPGAFEACRGVLRAAAFKPRDWGGFDDYSHADLPGSCLLSVQPDSLELGDHLIHELQHNRLQLVEERGPLFLGDGGERPRAYSPWRDSLRGLYGILHGVFVFLGVQRYWAGALASAPGDLDPARRAYALDRALRLPLQLRVAVGVLRRHARLTALGQAVLQVLEEDVRAVHQAAAASLPPDAPAWSVTADGACIPERDGAGRPCSVRGSLAAHRDRHDTEGQAAGLLEA
ncbi:MAG: HEXXH motif-containing putative peptide modification protein [Holophagaceae bacterium]